VVDAGDHIILIGRVVDFTHTSATPLGYCRGAYVDFSLSQEALAATGQRAQVGAILEHPAGLVLIETASGALQLPIGTRLEPLADAASLRGVLERYRLNANLDFLFAVFEEKGITHIYYRGRIVDDAPAAADVRYVPLGAIPWDRIRDPAVESMLRRYVKERTEDAFGIYVGDVEKGMVQALG
jgi:hypothetical protein